MKTQHIAGVIVVLFLSIHISPGQDTKVQWCSFNMGYNGPVAGNTMVRAVLGQDLAGVMRQSNTLIRSGFLANTLFSSAVTAVDNHDELPLTYSLAQNYPNPFNPTTTIRFEIPVEVHVALRVYNVLGQEVLVVLDEVKRPGRYDVRVEASALASGAYFYRMQAGDFLETRKLMLLK
jgi:hypothetical protein